MTSLVRRDPLRMDFPTWMTRLFEERPWGELLHETTGVSPVRVEEYEEGGTHVVRAELPGIDPEKDVDIAVQEGFLRITGQREERQERKDDASYRSEFRYGRFERVLRLPTGTGPDDITASYKDGVLEVRVKVREEASEPAHIKVARAD